MYISKAIMVAMAAILIVMAVMIGFVAYDNRLETIHPVGIMTGGDEQIHPVGFDIVGSAIPMSEVIYVPAYPDEDCAREDRILIDTPIRIEDENGTVRWHWIYENGTNARNRAAG